MSSKHTGKISFEEMRAAITRSGYLLEQRIKPQIERMGYFVETNAAFPDLQTGISREYDISAISAVRLWRERMDFIFPYILCECENNSQPVVFFQTGSPISFLFHEQVKMSGVPVKFWKDGAWQQMSEFLNFARFHHYCRGPIATQYCSLVSKGDRWIATHLEGHHQTFDVLINAVEAEVEEHYSNWTLPKTGEPESINVQIYYPLLVLAGDIYLARQTRRELVVRSVRHIQFRREIWTAKRRDDYQIDVIHESFLRNYLRMVEREMQAIKRRMGRKREEILRSIERLVGLARKARKRRTSWREIWEP